MASSIRLKTKTTPNLRYRVCFRLTHDDTVGVSVVDADDHIARVLTPGEPLRGGDAPHCFDWDGRADSGQPVPPGHYHVRLQLQDANRTAISGEQLKIGGGTQ